MKLWKIVEYGLGTLDEEVMRDRCHSQDGGPGNGD